MNADPSNPVAALCIQGAQAEFEGRSGDAAALYRQAWEICSDDYEACIAAHYMARFQDDPDQILFWNLESLRFARALHDDRAESFYPSLYINLAKAYEVKGDNLKAAEYRQLSSESFDRVFRAK